MKHLWIALAALSACANYDTARSWQGRSLDDLVAAWGPPSAGQRLGDGRTVAVYDHMNVSGVGGIVGTYRCQAKFTAGPDGQIATADASGDNGGCWDMLAGKPAGR